MNMKDQVIRLLEDYPDTIRKIALLRYELEHPAQISPEEMIEAMSFTHGHDEGRPVNHISNKTLYIALNYQNLAASVNHNSIDEITCRLFPLERETERLRHYVSLLEERLSKVVQLYYFERCSWEEIAKKLDVAQRTAQKLRYRAVEELERMYSFMRQAQ